MTRTRNLSDLLDSNGDVKSSALDNTSSDLVDDSTPQLGGDLSTNGNDVNFGDNDKAQFGAGNDLQVYHDGSQSIIQDTGTGPLRIRTPQFRVQNGSEIMLLADADSYTKLYHNGVEKLTTTSTGVDVTGTVTMDGGSTSADFSFGDNDKALFGAGNDLQIYHDGSQSVIEDVGTGNLQVRGSNLRLANGAGTKNYLVANDGAEVQLLHNHVKKFQTTSNGIETTGGTDISMSGSADGQIRIDGNGYAGAIALNGSNMHIYTNSSSRGIVFGTNETQRMRINGGGDVLAKAEGGSNEVSLRQGSSKNWVAVNQQSSHSIYDSYNTSSVADDGVGDTLVYINNNMNNSNFMMVAQDNLEGGTGNMPKAHSWAAGSYKCQVTDSFADDRQRLAMVVHGDLA